jgi:ATP dependent DNA ligase C terminal region
MVSACIRRVKQGDIWVKAKCLNRQEFVVVGWVEGEGSRKNLGALLLGYYSSRRLVYAGRVGTGMTPRELADLPRRLEPLAWTPCRSTRRRRAIEATPGKGNDRTPAGRFGGGAAQPVLYPNPRDGGRQCREQDGGTTCSLGRRCSRSFRVRSISPPTSRRRS